MGCPEQKGASRARDGDSEGGAPTTLLATRHADIPHVAREGESALLCDERDAEGLAENLIGLRSTPERWAEIGPRAGRSRVERHHAARPAARALEDH